MKNLSPKIKLIIGLAILTLVLLIATLYLQSTQFRIIKSTPDTNNYPSTMGVLVLEFSEKLDAKAIRDSYNKDASSVVKFDFDSSVYIDVYDKTIKITIQQTAQEGKYTLSLNNILSEDGDKFSKDIPFTVRNIDYDNMSEETQKLFDEYASEGESMPQDPIVKVLPHETDKYKISYIFPSEGAEVPATITITMKFFEPGDNALPATSEQRQAYLNDIRRYRTEALTYLKDQGIDINKYIIRYTEFDLRNEFPAGFVVRPEVGE